MKYTRSRRKESEVEVHQSAITDHVAQYNHTIDWDKVMFPAKEPQWKMRGIQEAIHIFKSRPNTLNRDGGRYQLSNVYSKLLPAATTTRLQH